MKIFALRRYLLCLIAFVATAHLTIVNPAFATAPKFTTDGPQAQVEYPAEELELLRATLLNVVDAVKELAGLVPNNTQSLERLEELRTQVEQLSAKDLTTFRRGLDPSKIDSTGLARARQTLADYKHSEPSFAVKSRQSQKGDVTPSSAGFPNASPSLGPRIGFEAMIIADQVHLAAEGVAAVTKDTCLQVVVVLGEGGNSSIACTVSDLIYFAAKQAWQYLHFVDDEVTRANLDTSYERLGHLHTDLENSVANDNTNTAGIKANTDSNAVSIKANTDSNAASIKANTDSNAANIISLINSKATTITSNATANTSTIVTAISDAATSVSGSASTGQTQVKDLIASTQIQADLARDSGSTPVALYFLPSSAGGLLDTVRSIVIQTIASIQATGGTVGTAQMFLTEGDQFKASGQFKKAYDSYRKAYQMAAKL